MTGTLAQHLSRGLSYTSQVVLWINIRKTSCTSEASCAGKTSVSLCLGDSAGKNGECRIKYPSSLSNRVVLPGAFSIGISWLGISVVYQRVTPHHLAVFPFSSRLTKIIAQQQQKNVYLPNPASQRCPTHLMDEIHPCGQTRHLKWESGPQQVITDTNRIRTGLVCTSWRSSSALNSLSQKNIRVK